MCGFVAGTAQHPKKTETRFEWESNSQLDQLQVIHTPFPTTPSSNKTFKGQVGIHYFFLRFSLEVIQISRILLCSWWSCVMRVNVSNFFSLHLFLIQLYPYLEIQILPRRLSLVPSSPETVKYREVSSFFGYFIGKYKPVGTMPNVLTRGMSHKSNKKSLHCRSFCLEKIFMYICWFVFYYFRVTCFH